MVLELSILSCPFLLFNLVYERRRCSHSQCSTVNVKLTFWMLLVIIRPHDWQFLVSLEMLEFLLYFTCLSFGFLFIFLFILLIIHLYSMFLLSNLPIT